ncbi:hypothetical protein K3495_g354 [Podosphaera aphanis]|nr:hypothetical protein K3495_g354 [Podosphaera aphanis]
MRHDSPNQPKPASSLPKQSQPHNWAAIATGSSTSVPSASAQPVSNNRSPRNTVQKPTVISKGPKSIFRLPEEAPLLKADATSVKAAPIKIVPGLKDGITSVTRSSSGFSITFSSEGLLKLAMEHSVSIKASLSRALYQVEDRIGHIVKRIPRTIWSPVSNLVSSTLDDVKNIAQAQKGVALSSAHWLLHENRHDPFHTAVIFFPKEVPNFRIVDSAPSRRYIPNPKTYKGKLIQPSDKEVTELRPSDRNKLRKARRAEAAAATAATTASGPVSAHGLTLTTGASTSVSHDILLPPA